MPKCKIIPITDKLAVIASTECDESQANVSHNNGVPESNYSWVVGR